MKKLTLFTAGFFLLPLGAALAQQLPPPPPPGPPAEAPAPAPDPNAPEKAGTMVLPPGFTREAIKDVIVSALVGREWQVIASDNTSAQAHLLHHRKDCTLLFHFDPSRIDIFSDSYVVNGSGVRGNRIIPNDWIENLEKDIHSSLSHMSSR